MFTCKTKLGLAALAAGFAMTAGQAWSGGGYELSHGFGQPATEAEITALAIAIPPSGEHLPAGSGTPAQGEQVYVENCSACHGDQLQGVKETGGAALIGGRGTLASGSPKKTVESYWPYATTVFDYVRRAMPFTSPGSLTNDEVYAVTAYILSKGNIIGANEEMNAETLPKVEMPNKDGFVPDPRPDVFNYD
jgi:mono/diheme cytochrome c family protein